MCELFHNILPLQMNKLYIVSQSTVCCHSLELDVKTFTVWWGNISNPRNRFIFKHVLKLYNFFWKFVIEKEIRFLLPFNYLLKNSYHVIVCFSRAIY